ncbi:MAG TPA: hypothetical protein DHW82_10905 [Spirochaetia bacterium]|nr:hypothetical protein [Spirochaetia bacterium]
MERTAVIIGTGSYAGETILTNDEAFDNVHKINPFKHEKKRYIQMLESKGLFQRRRISSPDETTSSLAVKAGQKALENAGIKPTELDLIILATDSPDFISPATSARVQHELGAFDVGFFDVNTGCASFTVSLYLAWCIMRSDEEMKHVLVIGSELASKFLDPGCIISQTTFGDGAGAVVLKSVPKKEYGIQAASVKGKGEFWNYFGVYAGGSWKGFSEEALKEGSQYLKMVKALPDEINVKNWPPIILDTIRKSGWDKNEIDRAFFTQSKIETIRKVCRVLEWKDEISYEIAQEYGYTGPACVPMSLDMANQKNLLKFGDKLLFCTSGTGTSYGVMTLVWGKP